MTPEERIDRLEKDAEIRIDDIRRMSEVINVHTIAIERLQEQVQALSQLVAWCIVPAQATRDALQLAVERRLFDTYALSDLAIGYIEGFWEKLEPQVRLMRDLEAQAMRDLEAADQLRAAQAAAVAQAGDGCECRDGEAAGAA